MILFETASMNTEEVISGTRITEFEIDFTCKVVRGDSSTSTAFSQEEIVPPVGFSGEAVE